MVFSTTEPSKQATAILQLIAYHGPMSGTMTWSGQVRKDSSFAIDGGRVTEGAIEGSPLPGMPVQIDMDTKDFAVEQAPSPSNGWRRLVIRSKKGKHAVLHITWKVVDDRE
jgi:hypothetical protein